MSTNDTLNQNFLKELADKCETMYGIFISCT